MATLATWFPTVADAEICRACELAAYGKAATVSQWQKLLSNKQAKIVAIGTKPIAVAVVVGRELLLVAVVGRHRRKGLGKQLLESLPKSLTARLPETNLTGLAFLKSLQWRATKLLRAAYGTAIDGIHLEQPKTLEVVSDQPKMVAPSSPS